MQATSTFCRLQLVRLFDGHSRRFIVLVLSSLCLWQARTLPFTLLPAFHSSSLRVLSRSRLAFLQLGCYQEGHRANFAERYFSCSHRPRPFTASCFRLLTNTFLTILFYLLHPLVFSMCVLFLVHSAFLLIWPCDHSFWTFDPDAYTGCLSIAPRRHE
ncbi:hypothetical protein F4780DRAFT_609431 [Xylariomycetidae sp. FL0641]|nr:hypothetical protein F4780DRAFT_609431 [Xylariomycetidae sp. FL0641]